MVRNDESSSGDGDEDENDGVEITFAEAPMIGDDDKEDEDENDGGKKTFIEAPMVEDDNDNDDDEGMEVGSGSLKPPMRYVLISKAGARGGRRRRAGHRKARDDCRPRQAPESPPRDCTSGGAYRQDEGDEEVLEGPRRRSQEGFSNADCTQGAYRHSDGTAQKV